jgi:hypothetical protein
MNSKAVFLIIAYSLAAMTACMYPPKKFTEKRLVIASNQTVNINELNMSITNSGCGRKWISEDNKPAYERPYCDLTVKMKDSTWHFGNSFDPLYIKNLKLVIDKMNPWGREEDSVPPGGCRIIVTKLDDISR